VPFVLSEKPVAKLAPELKSDPDPGLELRVLSDADVIVGLLAEAFRIHEDVPLEEYPPGAGVLCPVIAAIAASLGDLSFSFIRTVAS
jgi:hypothetical protein